MTIHKIEEASKLMGAALQGDRIAQGRVKGLVDGSSTHISESVSTSDLAAAFAIGLKQNLQAQYAKRHTSWTDFAVKKVFNDFKPQFIRELLFDDNTNLLTNGGKATMPQSLPRVPENTEYPSFGFTTSANGILLAKNGARFGFTWEAVINDEWDFISSIPGKLIEFAGNTEDTEAFGILASATGPNSTTFSVGNGNTNVNDAAHLFKAEHPLSLDALTLAKRAIRARVVNGRRVTVPKFRLIVPLALQDRAEAILGTTELVVRNSGNTTEVKTNISNSDVALTATDWLEQIDVSATAASTWYLVPDKGYDGTRQSLGVCFLQNNEKPDLRVSGNTGSYLGGGAVPGMEGSLLSDDIEYRVRHVVSGAFLNGQALLASKGDGAAAPAQYIVP
jgi:hypothetical protein